MLVLTGRLWLLAPGVWSVLMCRVARGFQLRIMLRQAERSKVTFDGFKRDVSCLWVRARWSSLYAQGMLADCRI
jgi:hypothetical protein